MSTTATKVDVAGLGDPKPEYIDGPPAPPKAQAEPRIVLTAINRGNVPEPQPGERVLCYTAKFITPAGPIFQQEAWIENRSHPATSSVTVFEVQHADGVKGACFSTYQQARERAREALGEWAAGCLGWDWNGGGLGDTDF